MAVEWYCQMMGSEVGPMSQSELVDMVRQQKLTPEDLVKRNNSQWVAAFEVKGLFEAAAKPARPTVYPTPPDVEAAPIAAAPSPAPVTPPISPARQMRPARSHQPAGALDSTASQGADWYCIASGEKQGPLGFSELQAMAADGRLRQTDRVWRSSAPKFCKAQDIEGLRVH